LDEECLEPPPSDDKAYMSDSLTDVSHTWEVTDDMYDLIRDTDVASLRHDIIHAHVTCKTLEDIPNGLTDHSNIADAAFARCVTWL
jgi:hypothetical protein